jgi:hypothetical protein
MRFLIFVSLALALAGRAARAETVLYSSGWCPCNDPDFIAKLKEQGKDCDCVREIQRVKPPEFIIDFRKLRGLGYRG